MKELLLISSIVVYIVDLSGFTDSWKNWLWKHFKTNTRSMKPFDCSQCMTWWVGLIYLWLSGRFTLPYIAIVGGLAYLSYTIGQVFIFIKEGLDWLIDKLTGLIV